jgi:hypothetical protein
MPIGGIMVLGHDFHSEAGFARSLAQYTKTPATPNSRYRISSTWRNLIPVLREANILPERCFYTNVYMGLRQGSGSTGRFPGSYDSGFVARCQTFLLRQLLAQQPRVVLTLGTWVPSFLAALSQQLCGWANCRRQTEIDGVGPVIHGACFRDIDMPACSVVSLTHPSMRRSNVHRRRFNSHQGHDAEIAMIREALGVFELAA